jgi:hypothetical protein
MNKPKPGKNKISKLAQKTSTKKAAVKEWGKIVEVAAKKRQNDIKKATPLHPPVGPLKKPAIQKISTKKK